MGNHLACVLPGGLSSSLICWSLIPSAQRRSKERSKGQLGELSAETDIQLHPDSTRSLSPVRDPPVSDWEIEIFEKTSIVRICTWKSVDEPAELFLGNAGPGEVQCDRLPFDDACEGLWTY